MGRSHFMPGLRGGNPSLPLLSEKVITDGEWYRIALVWDGLNRSLCVDDAVVAEDVQDGLKGSGNGFYIGTGKDMEPGTFWYDGGIIPPRPDCLEPERNLPRNGGSLLIGDGGAILSGVWSASPRIIPERKMRDYDQPKPTIPRSRGHHRDWIDACKGGPSPSSNFEYGARLTEIVLLGVVALRTGTTIHWDGPNLKATNAPQLEPVIHGHFRNGWEI